jgi:hypothetical protein
MSYNNYVEVECSQSPARFCKSVTSFLNQDEGSEYCDAVETPHKVTNSPSGKEPARIAFHKPQKGSVQKRVYIFVESSK